MKKCFAIFFLSVYLISLTELHQFVKLPVLVAHYMEHKTKNAGLSLWQFLDMHYAHGDVHDADYDEDMKLPFKSHDGCINTMLLAFVPDHFITEATRPVPSGKMNYQVYTEKFLPSTYLSSIWQPPKSC